MTEDETFRNAEEAASPADAPTPEETPTGDDPPDRLDASSGPGIGVGAGVAIGAAVGVLAAVGAALWFGIQRSAPDSDPVSPGDALTLAPAFPRPASGADILPPDRIGGSTMILQNIGDLDAVVVLADDTTYSRAVYVRTGDRVTIPNVAAGTYNVLMMLGSEWRASRFAQAVTYQQLDDAIEFVEQDVGSTTEYTQVTVSIEPVAAGVMGMHRTEPFYLSAP